MMGWGWGWSLAMDCFLWPERGPVGRYRTNTQSQAWRFYVKEVT